METDVLATKADINHAKALAKEAAKKAAHKEKEDNDKKGFEDAVKEASALRKKAAVHHNDVGDELPTADEVQEAAVKKTAK